MHAQLLFVMPTAHAQPFLNSVRALMRSFTKYKNTHPKDLPPDIAIYLANFTLMTLQLCHDGVKVVEGIDRTVPKQTLDGVAFPDHGVN